jgi:small conductance mechanosensitive channel
VWIGFKIANIIGRMLEKIMEKKEIDPTIERFVSSLLKNILKALVIVVAVGILGVEMTAFVAVFAAA